MILNKIDLTKIGPKLHAQLDKQLSNMKKFDKKLNISLDIKELFMTKYMPQIYITKLAEDKMDALVKLCATEIAWHGLVKKETSIEGDVYIIYDIIVYPQHVTGGTAEATDDVGMWYMKQPDEIFNHIRMQGHSHVNMGVTPSGVDKTYYDNLIEHVTDYYIFIILNKRNDMYIELRDVVNGITYEKLDLDIQFEQEENPIEVWAEEQMKLNIIKRPVTTPKPTEVPSYESGWGRLTLQEQAEVLNMSLAEYKAWRLEIERVNY